MLLVDKPAGPTSHDVVGATRRALNTKRVGHAGTLDPGATGLLVILVGRATRLMRFISLLPKRYAGTVRFGFETTTDDAAGAPTLTDDAPRSFTEADVTRALETIRARPTQVPPPVSAKKVDGVRAYKMARRGDDFELEPVPVAISLLRASSFELPDCLKLEVECSAGTYIRSIARDLGRELGTRAHLEALRRTGIGPWDVRDAIAFDAALAESAPAALRPMADAVAHLPRVELDADAARRFAFGQKLPAEGDGFAAVFGQGELLGVAAREDGLLKPEVGLTG